jgi:predicted SprT family Zn-dependent metalloprotease
MVVFDTTAVEPLARRLILELARTWKVPRAALAVQFVVNSRLRRSVARYLRKARVIQLGPRFFSVSSRHEEILCHELAHAAVDFVYGTRAKVHGPEWRQLVEAAGYHPAAQAAFTSLASRAASRQVAKTPRSFPGTVYVHRCPVCQMVRRARRPVPQWRCAACVAAGLSGTLQITKVYAA